MVVTLRVISDQFGATAPYRLLVKHSRSRDASASEFLLTGKKRCLKRTGGISFLPPLKNKGGGAPNGAPAVPASERDAGAVICDRSPFGAPPRLCAQGYSPQLGLGRASWNRRMQTGGPSPTPVQQAPCSPITRRTGRCPNRLQAKSDELRPQEPLPLRQSRHRLTSLTTSEMGIE